MKIREQIHLAKRLGFLLSANIPLPESLKMLERNSQSKKQKAILSVVDGEIARGKKPSESFKSAQAFNNFGLYLLKVGETTGTLSENFFYLAEELEKKQQLKQKIQGALFYPFFISTASLVLSILLITNVFPKILPILSGLNAQTLPLPTRVLIFLNSVIKSWGVYILGAAVCGGALLSFLIKKSSHFRLRMEKHLLQLPYLANFIIYYQLSNLARTLGLLLKSHLVVEEGLVMIFNHSSNLVYKKALHQVRERIFEGGRFAESLTEIKGGLFPAFFVEMVEVGEASGRLSETLIHLSDYYTGELEEKSKKLSSLLEPMLMIFMGLVIGGVALSIVMPIYQITASLNSR